VTLLVTLDQAKAQIRVAHDSDDDAILLAVAAASGAIINYLKSAADEFLDSSGDVVVDSSDIPQTPHVVQQATLILAALMYGDREGTTAVWKPGFLPPAIESLLYPLRDPGLA
jgi:hypothetical protein